MSSGFADWVRTRRHHAGLTQEQLAERAGVSTRTVRNVESGERGDPSPHTRRAITSALHHASALTAVPAVQLPPDITSFVGRLGELDDLDAAVTSRQSKPGRDLTAMPITVVCGAAGVGKTALAVRWAHRVRSRYPDGQLFLDLRGYGPSSAMVPAEALASLLRTLGMADDQIPAGECERTAALRSVLADRRILVVLDNASSAEQVRPLLPGTATCAVLVTSRDSLAGLVARDGAARLELELLPMPDSEELLRELIGPRAIEHSQATTQLAISCARLPLALRVAAELAVARPDESLPDLVAELSGSEALAALDSAADKHTAVTSVFSWSYGYLDPTAARAFRLLGQHPGPDFDLPAAAAMLDADSVEAVRLVRVLRRAHLCQRVDAGRYVMHELLRSYAVAVSRDRPDERRIALGRLFDHYVTHADQAMGLIHPAGEHPVAPSTDGEALKDASAALTWLAAHQAALVAAACVAAAAGYPDCPTALSSILRRYLDSSGRQVEALTVHGAALAAARKTGDQGAEALALLCIGSVYWRKADYARANAHLEHSLAIAVQLGDELSQARVLNNLGGVAAEQGHWDQAAQRCESALALFHARGDIQNAAITEANVGFIYLNLDQLSEAIGHTRTALRLSRQLGERYSEANALTFLGLLRSRQNRDDLAMRHQRRALQLYREIGHRPGEAGALRNLGDLHSRRGEGAVAIDYQRQALSTYRQSGDTGGEVQALIGLGDALHATAALYESRDAYTEALAIARTTGSRQELARAHDGLGRVLEDLGDQQAARRHWQEAWTLYADLGLPDADKMRTRLATAPPGR